MQLRGKALFSLLRLNWLEDPTLEVEPWQVEDLREAALDELYSRLSRLGFPMDEETFLSYVEKCESPEELIDVLCSEEIDMSSRDQAYLLLFELWRRLATDRQPLSIFCDQLDYLIGLYDEEKLYDDELLQEMLYSLRDILDLAIDDQEDPKEVFRLIASYCAHDLETFICDYISDQIDGENLLFAQEMLDGLQEYGIDRKRFTFLQVRVLSTTEENDGLFLLDELLSELEISPDLDLLLEIGEFLAHHGTAARFIRTISQASSLIKDERDFQDLLAIVIEYYISMDGEELARALEGMLDKRKNLDLFAPLKRDDPDLLAFLNALKDADWSEV